MTAAITPGPLLVLIMSETVKFGRKAGIQIAFVPLISDLPIILISFLILSKLNQFNHILSGISIAGALYLFILAADNISVSSQQSPCRSSGNRAVFKGVIANYLSPHAYLFWLILGGPLLIQALSISVVHGMAFLGGFYFFIVGVKVLFAFIFARGIRLMERKSYHLILKISGVLLALMGIWLLYDVFSNILINQGA